jgi:hypothetical protein
VNISEANATVRVLRRTGLIAVDRYAQEPSLDARDTVIEGDVALLCERAGKALGMTFQPYDDLADWLAAVDSDGAAQEVCRAMRAHVRHGGALPWPAVARPFEAWDELTRRPS